MAARVLECILLWFEDQTADEVLDMARQLARLRAAAFTDAGRRLSRRLLDLRVRYLELQVARLGEENTELRSLHADACTTRRTHLAQLRAVIMAYQRGNSVRRPLHIPHNVPALGEREVDIEAVVDVLRDLGTDDRARRAFRFQLRDIFEERYEDSEE
jgi:hypothetical protein